MNELPETRHSLLLRLAEPSDQAAWEDFMEIYQPIIIRMAMKRGLQLSDAQDLSQEVLTRVAKLANAWDPNREKGTFRGWLTRVTRNLVVDHFRKSSRQPSTPGDSWLLKTEQSHSPEQTSQLFDLEERRQIFYRAGEIARESFSENTWSAFWATCVNQVPAQQAADEIGISIGAVYIARSRVLAKIRTLVQESEQFSQVRSPRHEDN
jgi:RNA polymerase sigma-70 factor (ECF subfamily)